MAFSNIGVLPNFNAFALPLQPINSGIGADVFRTGNQSQNIGQVARSFSGADTQNDLVQQADLDRSASATIFRDVDITGTATFVNGEPRTTSIELGGPTFARIGAVFFQDQGINQYAFAQGVDFEGNPSRAGNSVSQGSNQVTTLNAETDLNVTAPTNLNTDQPVSTILNVGNGALVAGHQQGVVEPASQLPTLPAVETELVAPTSPVSLSASELNLLAPTVQTPSTLQQLNSSAVPFLSLPVVPSLSALDVTSGLSNGFSLASSSFFFPATMSNNIAAQLSPAPVLSNLFASLNLFA